MATSRRKDGKLADITGPGLTDRWGVTCTDLGASVIAPNGTLVSVFGDTFSGNSVGHGDWRSPVILIGTGDANHPISYQRAAGSDPEYAHQLWRYEHRTGKSGRPRRGIGTVIPSDLLRVGDTLYLHAVHDAPLQLPVVGSEWDAEDHANNRVAQLYGGYVLPGSKLDVTGGVGLVVSQWNTAHGWPYRAMQFRATLHDTTKTSAVNAE